MVIMLNALSKWFIILPMKKPFKLPWKCRISQVFVMSWRTSHAGLGSRTAQRNCRASRRGFHSGASGLRNFGSQQSMGICGIEASKIGIEYDRMLWLQWDTAKKNSATKTGAWVEGGTCEQRSKHFNVVPKYSVENRIPLMDCVIPQKNTYITFYSIPFHYLKLHYISISIYIYIYIYFFSFTFTLTSHYSTLQHITYTTLHYT